MFKRMTIYSYLGPVKAYKRLSDGCNLFMVFDIISVSTTDSVVNEIQIGLILLDFSGNFKFLCRKWD